MRKSAIVSSGIAREQRSVLVFLLTGVAVLATLAIAPATAQDIVATGNMPAPLSGNPPRPQWNDGTWAGGQWGSGQAPNSSSTYSTGPYSINSGADPSSFTFNGQSLRVASGGQLFISNQDNSTTTANLILAGGTVRAYESSPFFLQPNMFTYAGNIQVASDSTIDITASQRGSTLTFANGSLTGGGVFRVNAGVAGPGPSSKVTFNPNNFTMSGFTGSFAVDTGDLEVSETIFPNGAAINIATGATFSLPIGQGGGQVQVGTINGTGTFAFGASQFRIGTGNSSGTFNGALAGTGGVGSGVLVKVGTGTFTFNGNGAALAYGSIQAGTLALGTEASLPPGLEIRSGATFAAGTQVSEATIASALQGTWQIFSGAYFGLDTSLGNRTFNLSIGDVRDPADPSGQTLGTLNFSKIGSNTLRMMASNTYTGVTAVQAGAMVIGQTAALPRYNQAGAYTVQPGAALGVVTALSDQVVADMLATGNFQPNSSIAFDTTDGNRNYTVNVIDAASGNGALGVTKTGSGTLELSGSNSYTGVTGIWNGTLYVDSVVSLPGYNQPNKVDVFTGAKLVIGNGFSNANMAALLQNARFRANATLGIDTTDADRAYTANIPDSAAGGLVIEKVGTGALLLSGSNSYTGGTLVRAGTLEIASEASLPGYNTAGAYSIASGARLVLGSGVSNLAVDGILAADNFAANTTLGFNTTGGPRTYSGNIANASAGTRAVTKVGDGLLTLSGSNSYTGGTTITEGVLSIASAASLPGFSTGGAYSVASGASLAIGSTITDQQLTAILATGNFQGGAGVGFDTTGGNRTYSGTIGDTGSGPLSLTKVGTGILTLSGSNGFTGGTTVRAGTLVIASTAALPGFNEAGDFSVASGATLGVTNAVGDNAIADILATGNFAAGSAVGFDTSAGDRTYAAPVSDPNGVSLRLVKLGTNRLTVTGTNGYTGGTTVSAGTLEIASAAALPGYGTNGAFSVASGARLTVAAGVTDSEVAGILGTTNFQAGSEFGFDTTAGDRTYASAITGAIEVVKEGPGTLTLSGSNSYSGGTTVTEGAIAITSAASLPGYNTNGTFTVAAGGTMLVGNAVTAHAIADMLGTTNFRAGSAIGFNTTTGDRTYSAAITNTAQGSLGLTKTGPDALTLSGNNTYTGPTTVEAGELLINGSTAGSSAVSVVGGLLGGTGGVGGTLTVGGAGTLSPGDASAPIASFSGGATSFSAGSTFTFEVDSDDVLSLGTAADLMVVNGALSIASGSILDFTDIASSANPFPDQTTFALVNYTGAWNGGLFSFGGATLTDGARFLVGSQEWQIDYDSATGGSNFTGDYVSPSSFVTVTAITVVPEPATVSLLVVSASGLLALRRRRARRS